jgi:hypothetical protein
VKLETYRVLCWSGLLVGVLVILGIGLTFPPSVALEAIVLALVFFLPLSAIGIWLRLTWTERAIDEFDGAPMPGILGIAGVDIEPDPGDLSAKQLVQQVEQAENPGRRTPGAAEAPPLVHEEPNTKRCASCGASTTGSGSSYCRVCGGALA